MISKVAFQGYSPKFCSSGLMIESAGKFLFLKRVPGKVEGGKWGVPGGKKDVSDKDNLDAAIRETLEETGINVDRTDVKFVQTYYVRYPTFDFEYSVYHGRLEHQPRVVLNGKEHSDYKWLTLEDALKHELMMDEDVVVMDLLSVVL